jgi:Family of unknown function (DUF6064)
MTEWWTYRLSDFLMFSPAIYWRMVERMNRELWPLPLAMVVLGVGLVWLAMSRRPWAGAGVAVVLAAVWLWVGWAFHWQRYASINWAAAYLAAAFVLQGVLLLAAAGARAAVRATPPSAVARRIGVALATAGVLVWPLIGLAEGRPVAQAEVFGLMPEPTALATLGLLMAAPLRFTRGLAAIPALSLLVGLATAWAMRG